MTRLLRIDSSSRIIGSHSRILGDYAQSLWQEANPQGQVLRRDLASQGVEILRAETAAAFRISPENLTVEQTAALSLSNELIAELKSVDALLITAPMYNFSISAALKAWIDQVSRNGHTFSYENGDYRGLLKANWAIVICTYGTKEFEAGRQFASEDFLQPYLRFLLGSLGIQSIDFVAAHGTTTSPEKLAGIYARARSELDRLFEGKGV